MHPQPPRPHLLYLLQLILFPQLQPGSSFTGGLTSLWMGANVLLVNCQVASKVLRLVERNESGIKNDPPCYLINRNLLKQLCTGGTAHSPQKAPKLLKLAEKRRVLGSRPETWKVSW